MADTNENNQYKPSINWNHSQDIIFTEESLEEFIRLIRRGGLESLQVYSIYDELLKRSENYDDKNSPILDGEHKEFRGKRPWTAASNPTLLATQFAGNYRAYFVVVKTNIPLDDNFEENNILSGRHKYIKAGDEIDLTTGDIKGTVKFFKNGTPKTVFVKGLENFGNADATKFLRGDGTWNNFVTGSIYAGSNNYQKDFSSLSGQKNAGAVGPSGSIYFYSQAYTNGKENRGIAGFNRSGTAATVLYIDQDNVVHLQNSGTINPKEDNKYNLGSSTLRWKNIYGNQVNATTFMGDSFSGINGSFDNLKIGGAPIKPENLQTSYGQCNQFLRGGKTQNDITNPQWTDTLNGHLIIRAKDHPEGKKLLDNFIAIDNEIENANAITGRIRMSYSGGALGNYFWVSKDSDLRTDTNGVNFWALKIFNAVFNDYAECRQTIDLKPGHVVADNDNGSLYCTEARLIPGAQVISDTYGHLMGHSDTTQTPIAVAGRVLVYTYQPRENYHAGMAVCSAPGGTVDIMTREEIRDYPDCIIGIVSEIPEYETWGTDNVKVDGRIWIKVK